MQKSMTGYGSASAEFNQIFKVTVEVKTLNSKQADISTRMPKSLYENDYLIRARLSEALGRGKITLTAEVKYIDESITKSLINESLFKNYFTRLCQLTHIDPTNAAPLAAKVLELPEVMQSPENLFAEQEYETFKQAMEEALNKCDLFRADEGLKLQKELEKYANNINDALNQIAIYDPQRIENVRNKLSEGIKNLKIENPDNGRLEQEIIFYIEKFDITEEKVRLKKHLDYFVNMLNHEPAAGRKIGFIAQEIGREINTIGSKANHAEIQKLVVQMKDELEKIKEQSLNLL